MKHFSFEKFCRIFSGMLLVLGINWLFFMELNMHPYHVELTNHGEVLQAEGPLISGEISADESDREDVHQLYIVEREKQNLEMQLLLFIALFSSFIISVFQALSMKGIEEKEKTYRKLRKGALGVLVSICFVIIQYLIAGNALSNVFS